MTGPAQPAPADDGPVASYLDDVFDRLAGTSTAGRRALAEIEDHLSTATADEVARGRSPVDAERVVVARFGDPGRIAGQIRRTVAPSWAALAASSLWSLTGLLVLAAAIALVAKAIGGGVSYLLGLPGCQVSEMFREVIAGDGPTAIGSSHRFAHVAAVSVAESPVSCDLPYRAVPMVVLTGLVTSAGVAVLVAHLVAVRRGRLPRTPSWFPLAVGVMFLALATASLFAPASYVDLPLLGGGALVLPVPGVGEVSPLDQAAASVLMAMVAVLWYAVRPRRTKPAPLTGVRVSASESAEDNGSADLRFGPSTMEESA
jgi:hypothetical protein